VNAVLVALLVVSAEALPKVRAALRKMEPGMCETLAEAWEVAK
jgi:hypothetical protein